MLNPAKHIKTLNRLILFCFVVLVLPAGLLGQEVISIPLIEIDVTENSNHASSSVSSSLVLPTQKITSFNSSDPITERSFATALKVIKTSDYTARLGYKGLYLIQDESEFNLSSMLGIENISDFVIANQIIYALSSESVYAIDPLRFELLFSLDDLKIETIFTDGEQVFVSNEKQSFIIDSIDRKAELFSTSQIEALATSTSGNTLIVENDGKQQHLVSYQEINGINTDRQVIHTFDYISTVDLKYAEATNDFIIVTENSVYQSNSDVHDWNLLLTSASQIQALEIINGTLKLITLDNQIISIDSNGRISFIRTDLSDSPQHIERLSISRFSDKMTSLTTRFKVFSPPVEKNDFGLNLTAGYENYVGDYIENNSAQQGKWSDVIGSLYDEYLIHNSAAKRPFSSLPTLIFPNTNTNGTFFAFTGYGSTGNHIVEMQKRGSA